MWCTRFQASRTYGCGKASDATVPSIAGDTRLTSTSFLYGRASLVPACLFVLAAWGCDTFEEPDHPVPSASQIEAHYEYAGDLSVEVSGNVAQVKVTFDPVEFRRGGDLWAKAFPYIFLFSPATRDAMSEHPGLGGVRVIALHPNGDMVAQALLSRGVLTELTWNRALNISGQARREGTERPARMQDLVRWGEDHAEFEYNPDYIDTA